MMQDIAHYHAAGVPRPGDAKINSSTSMCWNLAVYWLGVLDPRPAYDFLRDNPEWEGTLDELTEIVEGVWIWELYEEDADVLLSISADKR